MGVFDTTRSVLSPSTDADGARDADPDDLLGIVAMGLIFGFILLIVLAVEAPFVLGALLLVALLGIGLATRSRLSTGYADGEQESETDPLTELERRYVAGEIDGEEFERRLSTILDAEQLAGRDVEPGTEQDFELEQKGCKTESRSRTTGR